MTITIRLQGFRRFEEAQIVLHRSTLLVGPNGAGKTTVLEALHYLSVGRSHRTSLDRELIGWAAPALHASIVFEEGLTVQRSLAEVGGVLTKRAEHNGVPLPLLRSLGLFHVVLFAPELIELLTGMPRLRRRYLDIVLSSTDQQYAEDLTLYTQALKQRNRLLVSRQTADAAFEPWEAILAARGTALIKARDGLVHYLSELLPKFYALLAPDGHTGLAALEYLPSISQLDRYPDLLAASRERDRFLSATSLGPHRDELRFMLGRRTASSGCSRGEQRSLLLALKRAELEFFAAQDAEVPPLLLLDDMFSELDRARSHALAELIASYQTVMTATDAATIPRSLRSSIDTVQLADGIPTPVAQ